MMANMPSTSLFGQPYKSAEEAAKGKRLSLLTLCALIAAQMALLLFFWWASIYSPDVPETASASFDGLIFLAFAAVLYFFNSRVAAALLLIFVLFELIATWVMKGAATGNYSPPVMALFLTAASIQLAMAIFKTYSWEQTNHVKLPRSKWVGAALIATFFGVLAAYWVPLFHFAVYTRGMLTDFGGSVEYHDSIDNYGFDMPKSWVPSYTPLVYGTVELAPTYSATPRRSQVTIERWEPYTIAAANLFNKDAFLKMVQGEAKDYDSANNATTTTVALIGPADSNVNAARAIHLHPDGSKTYLYYYYNRSWTRQTSKDAFYFWRVTANIAKDAPNDDAEFQDLIKSFRIDGFTVDSADKVNLEETRESFADFLAAQDMPATDLRNQLISEANMLLSGATPTRSALLQAFADMSTFTQKTPNDAQINALQSQIESKFGKCWGQPQGQCSK
jgi:hypothetical protein